MAPDAVLLDVDGTLLDTVPFYASVVAGTEAERGVVESRLGAGANIVQLLKETGMSRGRFIRGCLNQLDCLRPYPAVADTLRGLDDVGVQLAVITNLPKDIMKPILDSFDWNDRIATHVYAARKPRPGGVRQILSSFHLAAGPDIYLVGDRDADAVAAAAAGISFAWASYGYGDLEPGIASVVLERFEDLLAL
jgi:phosphoglycolate phosphatase